METQISFEEFENEFGKIDAHSEAPIISEESSVVSESTPPQSDEEPDVPPPVIQKKPVAPQTEKRSILPLVQPKPT